MHLKPSVPVHRSVSEWITRVLAMNTRSAYFEGLSKEDSSAQRTLRNSEVFSYFVGACDEKVRTSPTIATLGPTPIPLNLRMEVQLE